MGTRSLKLNELLKKLKLSEEVKLSDDLDFEWMWEDPQCAKFLDWITENLTKNNVITPRERRQFEILTQQGHVLSGRHLEEAMRALNSADDIDESSLDEQIRSMTEASERLNTRKNRLKQISFDLGRKISQTEERIDANDELNDNLQRDLREQLLKCEREHLKFQDKLADLAALVEKLNLLYTGSDSGSAPLLCRADLHDLHQADQEFTEALAQFTDKRFFNGLSDVAGDRDESYYQLVDVSDPNLLSVRQDTDEHLLDSSSELNRLRQVHAVSLDQNIEARVNSVICESACETLEQKTSSVEELSRMSDSQLQNQLERARGKLSIYSRELSLVKDRDLRSLVEQTTTLKEAYVLTGDYNLKITRQQYFLGCQQQVIDKLIDQRARNEVVTLMLEVEMEDVQQTRHVLASVTAYLQQLITASGQQMAVLEDAEMMSSKYDRMVIDSKDVLLNTVDKLLEEDREEKNRKGKVFTSYKELVSSAQHMVELHKERTITDQSVEHRLRAMRESSDACLSELELTSADSLSLTPAEVTNGISNLKDQLKLLESNIKTIMSTITQKRKLLAGR